MSRIVTLWQRLSAITLSAAPGVLAGGLPGSLASAQCAAADQAWSKNSDVMDSFAPDEAVVPMIVSKILVAFERRVRLRRIVAARRRRHDRRTGFKIELTKFLSRMEWQT
jgi:hypothetical protein